MMGFGIAWVMQIHMSWPLLLPYAGLALLDRARRELARALRATLLAFGGRLRHAGGAAAADAARLRPARGWRRDGRNLHLHVVSPAVLLTTPAGSWRFPSLEVLRFSGTDTAKRVVMVSRHPWIAPLLGVVWLVGIVHPLLDGRARGSGGGTRTAPTGRRCGCWSAGSIVVVYAAYFFVMEPPQAHAFYVLSPIAMLFAVYCWSFIDGPRWRRVAAAVLAVEHRLPRAASRS